MNANQFNEKWMEFKGELKQQWDKFTDEDLQQEKRALMRWADVWHQKSVPEAHEETPR